ncbi:hypothetical protein BT96DRAFT_489839 [Gymnopus androsaceus JB14]|uniref:Uncharacterized protein n=1 Tax=Gymnopus androsaceus JB14 TaxID=1447944 RepID=A0A6A4HZD6_9AGAR|nr:hypothetical protein BT96DRAFT_489839 [Gymnopus androsaceus JB14]
MPILSIDDSLVPLSGGHGGHGIMLSLTGVTTKSISPSFTQANKATSIVSLHFAIARDDVNSDCDDNIACIIDSGASGGRAQPSPIGTSPTTSSTTTAPTSTNSPAPTASVSTTPTSNDSSNPTNTNSSTPGASTSSDFSTISSAGHTTTYSSSASLTQPKPTTASTSAGNTRQ